MKTNSSEAGARAEKQRIEQQRREAEKAARKPRNETDEQLNPAQGADRHMGFNKP